MNFPEALEKESPLDDVEAMFNVPPARALTPPDPPASLRAAVYSIEDRSSTAPPRSTFGDKLPARPENLRVARRLRGQKIFIPLVMFPSTEN